MNKKTLNEAKEEALSFLTIVELALKEAEEDKLFYIRGTSLSGKVKRQSRDLSQALVDMRKPN